MTTTVQTKRLCRTCPPGRPTILSRYNDADTCSTCQAHEVERFAEELETRTAARQVTRYGRPSRSREDLTRLLQEWVARNGRLPEIAGHVGLPTRPTYRKAFGSWAAACEAAGFTPVGAGRKRTSPARAATIGALRAGAQNAAQICEATGINPNSIRRVLSQMHDEGLVGKTQMKRTQGSGPRVRWFLIDGSGA